MTDTAQPAGCPAEEIQGVDPMQIRASADHMTPAEVALWDGLRAYLGSVRSFGCNFSAPPKSSCVRAVVL